VENHKIFGYEISQNPDHTLSILLL
jgi:hypothetical protein